jgi:hypothetical protein
MGSLKHLKTFGLNKEEESPEAKSKYGYGVWNKQLSRSSVTSKHKSSI